MILHTAASLLSLSSSHKSLTLRVTTFRFLEGNTFQGLSHYLALTYTTFPALVNTLKEMREGKEEKLRTIKLLVVGDAAVGKTTLLLSLQGHNTKQANKPLATDGVDLGELILEDNTHFTCYDFAGQVLVLHFPLTIPFFFEDLFVWSFLYLLHFFLLSHKGNL